MIDEFEKIGSMFGAIFSREPVETLDLDDVSFHICNKSNKIKLVY